MYVSKKCSVKSNCILGIKLATQLTFSLSFILLEFVFGHSQHLERNFSNILMLVSRSLDTLTAVLTKNKGKGEEDKAIAMAQKVRQQTNPVACRVDPTLVKSIINRIV